jgi:hypothetical protein
LIDVEATLNRLGVAGRASGDEFVARCPMHRVRTGNEDSHPSWSINLRTGLFLCFSCGYAGSIHRLIVDMGGAPDVEQAKTFAVRGSLQNTLKSIPGPYHAPNPKPLLPESSLAGFGKPPRWALRERNLTAQSCEHYEVLWDPYDDCWILPIRDPQGGLLGWQVKGQSTRTFRNHPVGVKKSETLFGYSVFAGGLMVVVESPLDAVRLHAEGIPGGVAVFGAIVSRQQIMLMSAADEVVLALDADAAGRKASRQLLNATRGVLKAVRFFSYTDDTRKDPGELSAEEIESGIRNAKSRVLGEAAL